MMNKCRHKSDANGRAACNDLPTTLMPLLICFPHAGAGASFFRSWVEPLTGFFEILPVQLPGREERFAERPYISVKEAIASLLPELVPKLQSGSDIVLFGHSVGAPLAFELAVRLTKDCGVRVCRLVVSGAHAPTRLRKKRASGLTDEQFVARIQELAGYSHPALENAEMRELLLPMLRADVQMHETYVPPLIRPLGIPITSIRGLSDELVSRAELACWQELTTDRLDLREVTGGHMYLVDDPPVLFDTLANLARSTA
jgi:surfactin synthase thioesterase subunit